MFVLQIYNFSCINGANVCVFIYHAHVCTSFFCSNLDQYTITFLPSTT
ncbi:unknown [Prevotella sp. CAG:5226]|nr:unknown [Prevotella sp. CAG:5226]